MVASPQLAETVILWRIYCGHLGWVLGFAVKSSFLGAMPDINLRHLPETAPAGCWLYWRHNAGLVTHWNHAIDWSRTFSSSYSLSWFDLWGGLMKDGAISAYLSSATHCGTTSSLGLLNQTMSGKGNCAHIHGVYVWLLNTRVNNFLSFGFVVYSWQTGVTVLPTVVFNVFPPTVEQKVRLYMHNAL